MSDKIGARTSSIDFRASASRPASARYLPQQQHHYKARLPVSPSRDLMGW
jgi:hypothetical protein